MKHYLNRKSQFMIPSCKSFPCLPYPPFLAFWLSHFPVYISYLSHSSGCLACFQGGQVCSQRPQCCIYEACNPCFERGMSKVPNITWNPSVEGFEFSKNSDEDEKWCAVWEKAWNERKSYLEESSKLEGGQHGRMATCSRHDPNNLVSITSILCIE